MKTTERKVVKTGKFTATNEGVKTAGGKKVDADAIRAAAKKEAADE